jgi:hypothetical protein
MTKFNPTYKNKLLQILDQDNVLPKLSLSAPAKIAGSRKWAFSLPAGPDFTCPGATDACKSCYAQKGRHVFPNVQKSLIGNYKSFEIYRSNADVDGLSNSLLKLLSPSVPIFRIHESGDFSDQFAIQTWKKVAEARPETKFWFYTRSFSLDFTELLALPNVNGWASTDEYNSKEATAFAIKHGIKQAFGPWKKDNTLPQNSFVCPATSGKLGLEAACNKCQLCIVKNRTPKNVVFNAH